MNHLYAARNWFLDHIFHQVRFLLLTEVQLGITQAYIGQVIDCFAYLRKIFGFKDKQNC
jgi:hypothetical protein